MNNIIMESYTQFNNLYNFIYDDYFICKMCLEKSSELTIFISPNLQICPNCSIIHRNKQYKIISLCAINLNLSHDIEDLIIHFL